MSKENQTKEPKGLYYTKKEPRKAFATFMRNQNKMYVNSFNMIDRKAAIMIRVNATIISAIVIFFEHINDLDYGAIIGIVMVISSFISLMFAINASRPNTFSLLKRYKNNIGDKYPNLEENIFGVGMFDSVSLEDYEEAYNKLASSQELQIGNQVRTMYIFEAQVKKAFSHIEIAYTSFMIGFVIVVLAFLFSNFSNLL